MAAVVAIDTPSRLARATHVGYYSSTLTGDVHRPLISIIHLRGKLSSCLAPKRNMCYPNKYVTCNIIGGGGAFTVKFRVCDAGFRLMFQGRTHFVER